MPAYQKILAALDLESRSDKPIISANRLALEQQAELHAVAVVRPQLLLGKGFFTAEVVDRNALIEEARSALQSRLEFHCNIAPGADVVVGKPSKAIVNVAEQRASGLIVLGAKRREGLEVILGTTATNILRLAVSVDIYACHRSNPDTPTHRIMVAIDGSKFSAHVLSAARTFVTTAQAAGTAYAVQVVCVVPDESSESESIVRAARSYLQGTDWNDLRVCVEAGGVVDGLGRAILDFDSDLLIIGYGENTGLGWAIGSTTNSLLHEVSCDVLVRRA